MDQNKPTIDPLAKSVTRLHGALDRMEPWLIPALVLLGVVCVGTLIVVGILAAKNLTWGWGVRVGDHDREAAVHHSGSAPLLCATAIQGTGSGSARCAADDAP